MLNMRSADGSADDRTARAKIRDAAITRFAVDGIADTTVRAIAAEAGVSPGLVIHHFGTKDGLRHACDEHIATVIRAHKRDAMAQGPTLDPLAAMRSAKQDVPLLRYLGRSIADGSSAVSALIDEMIGDATIYMEDGVAAGTLRSTAFPRRRAALLTLWMLGAMVLHEHVERLLGVDLMRDPAEIADDPAYLDYLALVVEMLADGVFTDEAAARVRAVAELEPQGRNGV
jgi:AcrR family transcriptional regulator